MELSELILGYIEVLIWPIITVIILIAFRKEISKLFNRAKKVDLPGGFSIEAFDDKVQEAKKIEQELITERKPEIKDLITHRSRKDSEENKRMIELGLRPSPSGLDLSYYRDLANSDIQLALAGLRMDLNLMLRNLATGYKIEVDKSDSINRMIDKLLQKNAILSSQAEFMRIIFELTNYAVHGGDLSLRRFEEVLELGQTLVDDYIAWLDWGFR